MRLYKRGACLLVTFLVLCLQPLQAAATEPISVGTYIVIALYGELSGATVIGGSSVAWSAVVPVGGAASAGAPTFVGTGIWPITQAYASGQVSSLLGTVELHAVSGGGYTMSGSGSLSTMTGLANPSQTQFFNTITSMLNGQPAASGAVVQPATGQVVSVLTSEVSGLAAYGLYAIIAVEVAILAWEIYYIASNCGLTLENCDMSEAYGIDATLAALGAAVDYFGSQLSNIHATLPSSADLIIDDLIASSPSTEQTYASDPDAYLSEDNSSSLFGGSTSGSTSFLSNGCSLPGGVKFYDCDYGDWWNPLDGGCRICNCNSPCPFNAVFR